MNFKNNTQIIDLTGQSPGFIYAFWGRSIGDGWLSGGWRGANDYVKSLLKTGD